MSTRRSSFSLFLAVSIIISVGGLMGPRLASQGTSPQIPLIVGRNVNMISGTQLPDGDPYLQRQNEPSIAVSTRNPMHLLAGVNDYRTIDLPFEDQVPGQEFGNQALDRDAWLGVLKSFDEGQSWKAYLLEGFPQDISTLGAVSPLKAFGTAADPVVRAGTNGLFYYAGIAFNRIDRGTGAIFVARFIDLNNQENADTIKYDGVTIVDQGNAGVFLDKVWMAVDIPRAGHGYTTLSTSSQEETVPCGNVYLAYSAFLGKTDINIRSKIMFTRSTDCGKTWSAPIKLSETQHTDQGTTIAIDPTTGAVYVAWRRFATASQGNAIVLVRSTDGGQTFTKPMVVRSLALSFPAGPNGPFDQRTTGSTFRTNSHPTIYVDLNGTVYLAWAERRQNNWSRIVLTYSKDQGMTWVTPPIEVDPIVEGHQFMPSLAGGMLTWYDQRNDISLHLSDFVDDVKNGHRHTIDVRAAKIDPVALANAASFIHPSKQVSRYLYELEGWNENGELMLKQVQYYFSGLEMFQRGTVPFLGDYIDIAPAPVFVPAAGGGWQYNPDPAGSTVYHVAWGGDTRDVKFPELNGVPNLWPNWENYKAPNSSQDDPLFPDPNACYPGHAGLMNQNAYTACISPGFVAGSPGNTKPLDLEDATDTNGFPIARAFTVTVKNTTYEDHYYRLWIEAPPGVLASFVQYFDIDPNATYPNFPTGFPVDDVLVAVAAQSSISRPVFVYPFPDNPQATVKVHVEEEAGTLASVVFINPDPTNPEIIDPLEWDPQAPHIKGSEVHNPHIKGKSIKNYSMDGLVNPHIKGLDPILRDVINSDTANPHIKGDVLNPHIKGTDIEAPHIKGESISEITWEVTNEGNTTTPYTFDVFTTYNPPGSNIPPEEAIQFQLLVYKVYKTPVAEDCNLAEEEHHELVVNISNPHIKGPHIKGSPPSLASVPLADPKDAAFWLNPKEKAIVKLWAIDPNTDNTDTFEFGPDCEEGEDFPADVNADVTVTSQAHNTEDLENGDYTLPSETSLPPGPGLVAPLPGAELDNGCKSIPAAGTIEWDFDWTTVAGATAYHLYVLGPDATTPLINNELIGAPSYHFSGPGDYIDDTNLYGWVWMVRALVNDGVNNVWTGWSEVRSFDVAPPTDCAVASPPEINIQQGGADIDDGGNYDFGYHPVGSDTPATFTIHNLGTVADLEVTGAPALTGPNTDQFVIEGPSVTTIGALQSTTFVVRFQPTSPGAKTATLSIDNDDPDENPYDIHLSGNGAPLGGLVAYYPFNNNADDESGQGHNGTIYGSYAFSEDRFGNPNGALNFDGSTNFVELPDESSFDLSQITIVAIVKVFNYAQDNRIIAKGENFGSFTVDIAGTSGRPYYTYQHSYGNRTDPLAMEAVGQNQFFHLVSTYDAQTLQLRGYLNGEPKVSATTTYPPLFNDQNVTIGLSPFPDPTPDRYFSGVIDEIRIYNRILSAEEVQALYSLDLGLVAHYPFHGDASDQSGHGLNGTINGATLTEDRLGVTNRAFSFNGSSDFIDVPDDDALDLTSAITISTWINPVEVEVSSSYVVMKRDDGATGGGSVYSLDYYPGMVRSVFKYPWPGGGYNTILTTGNTPITPNEWQHIVVTWDGATIIVYRNGSSDGTQAFASQTKASDSPLLIGRYSGYYFNGKIDEVRIYDRALSPSEVMALYALGK